MFAEDQVGKTYLYVDSATLKTNALKNAVSPPIVVTTGGNFEAPRAGCRVKINGPCEIVYDKRGVVFDGHEARVVVVTESEVEIEMEYGK